MHAPVLVRSLKPLLVWPVWLGMPKLRRTMLDNARRLLGPSSRPAQRRRLARAMLSNFGDAILEFGQNRRLGPDQIQAKLESIAGEGRFAQLRELRRGAIIVTAHLGPFETAITILAQREPRVHVVFRRDALPIFEKMRAEQHARLGVLEAPVDDGLAVWIRLRDALWNNDVVLMQGDRVMPGQPGVAVPFLGGHVRVPIGPVKLARITGSPIVPAFAIKIARNRIRVVLEEPIWPEEFPASAAGIDPALLRLTAVIERFIKQYPEQWLCLHAAWCDDAPPAVERAA